MSIIIPRREQILRKPDLESITGLDRATIARLIQKGQFPRPVRLSLRAVGWKASDVEEWIRSRQLTVQA
ncbi:MAG: AlpA family phage regulatory protein [Deltaproteobacteria bacterium]|nr:AlpA family phage regulatory protein [Deltaproteobacteria bacterium]